MIPHVRRPFFLFFFFSFFFLVLSGAKGFAIGLGAFPTALSVENALRNHTYGREITLLNPNDETVTFNIIQETKSGVRVAALPAEGTIPARQKKTINIFIFVPANLSNGQYEDLLLEKVHGTNSKEVTVNPSLAIPVYTSVIGNADPFVSDEQQDEQQNLYEINELSDDTAREEDLLTAAPAIEGEWPKERERTPSADDSETSFTTPEQDAGNQKNIIGKASAFFGKQQLSSVDVGAFVLFLGMLIVFTVMTLREPKRQGEKRKHRRR